MTPSGMRFSTLAGQIGGGVQAPGFVGHSKLYISSEKFIRADGGYQRIVWMPRVLKDDVRERLNALAAKDGIEDFVSMIADEDVAESEEEVLEHLQKIGHPALEMDPMM